MDQPAFLMTDPAHFGVIYQINPWMQPNNWTAASLAAAKESSAALRRALLSAGAKVETINAVPGLPDLVFPANGAIILDGRVLKARFRHSERQGEEAIFHAAFQTLQKRGLITEIVDLPEGVIQEGAGDCIWDADRQLFWVGYGQRSTSPAVAAIEASFGQPLVALELASPHFYHLDTCFCPLGGGKLLFYPPAFTARALAAIHANVAPEDRIEASDEDAAAFCVNAVNIGRHIIMARAPARLRARLTELGFVLDEVDLAPFMLSGGAAYCMTLRLDRQSRRALPCEAA